MDSVTQGLVQIVLVDSALSQVNHWNSIVITDFLNHLSNLIQSLRSII